MATSARAQATLFALRRKISSIEGNPALTLDSSLDVLEAAAADRESQLGLLATGAENFDRSLGGGVPLAALTEIHAPQTRDASTAAGFALTLAALLRMRKPAGRSGRILWIGSGEAFGEAGFPYAPGLSAFCGIPAGAFFFSQVSRTADALWIAEEATPVEEIETVFLELRGNPRQLDLTATRRLHRRAERAGKPVFLLRQSGSPEPTAAPVRLIASGAPAGQRMTIAGSLVGSIGPPAFTVSIGKSRKGFSGQFILEWNPHERIYRERRRGSETENSGPLVSVSRNGANPAPAFRALMEERHAPTREAARDQLPGEQQPADRRPRRTG